MERLPEDLETTQITDRELNPNISTDCLVVALLNQEATEDPSSAKPKHPHNWKPIDPEDDSMIF